ncbi:facilitated trehalose transporter Tret1-like [Cydia pomonella]|uniref:facilitated trehalose transporter Tret1-like n=1 Tax=Cydia pomonella TaxID=82600 RepID=UPI002ADD4A9A|nr:facilitated trehalose transporter Tret1-like [Cydia pomonella]XP_061723493.1 facilitated trehalose transporter Tret1-like [Cydia pomonella]XP_061723494.1 facilitated trehalose transporter Tret1-like [Cydia pomonella]
MDERTYSYDPVPGAPVTNRPTMEKGQLWRQYVIAGVANIAIASTGYSMGWTSPINIKLKDGNLTDSPLPAPITSAEEAWIGSILTLGAILGPFIGGPLASRVGRRWSLIASSIPLFVGWILIAAATSVAFLYAGRFMWGVGVGMLFTVSPMYCAEIATDDSRGALGSFLQAFITLGFLLVYAIGPFISYSAVAYVGVGFVAVFDILFYFMPETPIYYLTKNDRESAANCLMTIRGQSRSGVEAELDLMASDVAASMAKTATIADVFRGSNFKAFYISCALVFFQQFCGINAVLFYMTNIFEAAGSALDSSIATIIIGAVQVGASCVTPFVVDRLGRRMLLLFSACGTTIGLVLLGMFFLLDDLDSPVVASIGFLPILSLVVFIVTYCVGLGPLPWAVMSELFPIEVKAQAAPIATAFCWTLSFLVTRYFGPISEVLGMYAAFWIFGVCCIIAFFFTLFLVPETKGKSFAEIQAMLSGKPSKGKA